MSDCPRSGTDDLESRILIATHDRGAIRACCRCGEQIGPAVMPVTDPASSSSLDLVRPAGKLAHGVDLLRRAS